MAGDYLSILEFSKLSGESASKLRYWDKVGLLHPAHRSDKNNYRQYERSQIDALNLITTLSSLGLSHKSITELLASRNPELMSNLLHKLDAQLIHDIDTLLRRCSFIHAWREMIYLGMTATDGSIQEMELDERKMNELPRNVYDSGENFMTPIFTYLSQSKSLGMNPLLPMAWLYDSIESFKVSSDCPNYFLSIDPDGKTVRRAGRYLVGFVRGNYGELGDMPDRMIEYAAAHSLSLSGPVYAMYIHTHFCTNDPSQYLAKCSVAIA